MHDHTDSIDPKPRAARTEHTRMRPLPATMRPTLAMSWAHEPLKLGFMAGIMASMTASEATMATEATANMVRHPSHWPTMPLTTREARMPHSSPLSTHPMLRALSAGREYWPAMGMNSCGTTEQAPITSDAAHSTHASVAMAMAAVISAAPTMHVTMMRRRDHRSPSGMMRHRPRA